MTEITIVLTPDQERAINRIVEREQDPEVTQERVARVCMAVGLLSYLANATDVLTKPTRQIAAIQSIVDDWTLNGGDPNSGLLQELRGALSG